MTSKIFNAATFWVVILLLVMPCSQVVFAETVNSEKTLQRTVDPVIITGEKLTGLIGMDIDSIRVFAFQKGKAIPVPFQVDQRNSNGDWVWDIVYRQQLNFDEEGFHLPATRKPTSHGSGTVDDQDPRGRTVLDENDVLVLVAQDLGDHSETPYDIANAELVLEVEVIDVVTGKRGWAYVACFKGEPPPLSSTHYMYYSTIQNTVQSPLYKFNLSDDHPALISDLHINNYPIAEHIKLKGEVTLSLPLPTWQIKFSEEDIHGYTKGYIEGPVRIIKRNIAYLSLSGGLVTTRDLTCDHFYYPWHVEIPVCFSIRFPVKEVAMTLTIDYVDPPFHHLYMGKAKDHVHASGDDSSLRSHMHQLGTEWIALESHEASLISLMFLPDGLEGHADTQPCLCSGQLKPGQIKTSPGKQTEAGFLITISDKCPKGEHVVYGAHLIVDRSYDPGDEDAALDLQHNKLTTHVSTVPPIQ
jgi:hypothetical protein